MSKVSEAIFSLTIKSEPFEPFDYDEVVKKVLENNGGIPDECLLFPADYSDVEGIAELKK